MNWWCMIISGLIVVVLKIVGMTLFLLYFPQIFGKSDDSFSPTGSYGTVPQIFGNGNDSFSPTESYGTGYSLRCYTCLNPGGACTVVNNCIVNFDACLYAKAETQTYYQCWKFDNCNYNYLSKHLGEKTLQYECCRKDLFCPSNWNFHQGRCFLLSTSEMSWNKSMDMCKEQESTLAIVNTPEKLKFLQKITGPEKYFIGLLYQHAKKSWHWINNSVFNGTITNQLQDFHCVTIGLTNTFDAASCNTAYRWICEKRAK